VRQHTFPTLLFVGCIAAWGVGRYFLGSISDPAQLWDAQVKLVQVIVVVAALIVAWRQSQTAIDQLRLSREKRASEELQDARKQIRDLVEAKQIVLTERNDNGDGYRIVNVGQTTAINVWLIEDGKAPKALGSLAPNASRPFPDPPARHILIAESRPHRDRRFNRSLNALTRAGNFCHGFLDPEKPQKGSPSSLHYDGDIAGYLALEPNQWRRFAEWCAGIDDCASVVREQAPGSAGM